MTGTEATTKPADDAGILVTWRESPPAVKALLVGIFVNRLGAFLQIFVVFFLTQERDYTSVQAGFALGAHAFGAVFGVLAGGTLTDRMGARRTVLVSMVSVAVLVLGVFYLPSYAAIVAAMALAGAANGLYRPASATLMSALTPAHRQVMVFAMYRLGYNLGITAAPLIGAALLSVSYELLFWGEATAALGYAVIAAIALPRKIKRSARPGAAAASDEAPVGRSGYLAVLADWRYSLFLFAFFINALVYIQYLSVLPVAMSSAGLGPGWFSVVVAVNGFIVITCELFITKYTQRWPMRLVVIFGFVFLAVGQGMYGLPFGGAGVFLLGTLVWTLAEIVAGPTIAAYPAVASPERLRGRYIAASSAVFGIGAAVGPPIGLALWEQIGPAVWFWCAMACVLGVVATWYGVHAAEPAPDAAAADADEAADADAEAAAEPADGPGTADEPATAGQPGPDGAGPAPLQPALTTAAATEPGDATRDESTRDEATPRP